MAAQKRNHSGDTGRVTCDKCGAEAPNGTFNKPHRKCPDKKNRGTWRKGQAV